MRITLANHAEVAHFFAHKRQSRGQSNNMFFDSASLYGVVNRWKEKLPYGDCLFSYGEHFCLAQWISENLIYINDSSWSISTSKHQSIARSALSHIPQVLHSNLDLVGTVQWMENNLSKLAKARKPELYIREVENAWNGHLRAKEILKAHKVKYQKSDELYHLLQVGNRKLFNRGKKLFELMQSGDLSGVKDQIKAQKKEAEKRLQAKLKKEVKDFFSYDRRSLGYSHKYTYLRLAENGQAIETSKSYDITIDEAKSLFNAHKAGVDLVGKQARGFRIDRVTDKLVVIGCHQIKWENIEFVFSQLEGRK